MQKITKQEFGNLEIQISLHEVIWETSDGLAPRF